MAPHLPGGYVFDQDDPRAPTDEQWAAMTPAERTRVVAMLPAEDRAREAEERVAGLERRLREAEAEIERLEGGGG